MTTVPNAVAADSPVPTDLPAWLRTDSFAVPMLPALASRIVELASDPDLSIHMLSAVVSKDQILAARVLGLAN